MVLSDMVLKPNAHIFDSESVDENISRLKMIPKMARVMMALIVGEQGFVTDNRMPQLTIG